MTKRRLVLPAAGVALAAVLAAVMTACTTTVDGTAHQAGDDPTAQTPAPEPTGPLPSFGESATLIESRRLAYPTPRPDVIDPAFTNTCLPTFPAKSVDALAGFGSLFLDKTVDAIKKWGFVAAYIQCRSDPKNGRGTVAAAIEMRDEGSARGVVQDMVPTLVDKGEGETAKPLGQVEGATSILGKDHEGRHVMQTVVPFGRLVLYQYSDDNDTGRLASTVVKTLESAVERARNYVPTELEHMDQLQDDPHHLRPLIYKPEGGTFVTGGGYSLEAYWGVATDPVAEVELLRSAGYQAYYNHQGEKASYGVYLLRDAAAVRHVLTEFEKIDRRVHPDITPVAVPGVPSPGGCWAFMAERDNPAQRCFFGHDKYLWQIDAYGFDKKDLKNPKFITEAIGNQLTVAPK